MDDYEDDGFKMLGEAFVAEDDKKGLDKEDEIGHADLVFDEMCEDFGTVIRPVYCGGAWYQYSNVTGIWRIIEESKVHKFIMRLPGLAVWTTARTVKRVALTNAKINSIESTMKKMVADDSFFEEAIPAMAFNNLTLRFDKGASVPSKHLSEFRCRSHFDFDFSPSASCTAWLRFLGEVFEGDDDVDEKVAFLQEFVGAAMRWQSTHYERIALLLGYQGQNGKSIFCDVIGQLFKNSMCAVPPQDLSTKENRVSLDGAQLNLVTDIPVTPMKDTGGLKQVTSGDKIAARRLHRQEYMFTPKAGHLYSANLLPRSPDMSNGFYRRWVVVMFNRSFAGTAARGREEILEELVAELPGIALWALKGSRRVAARGRYLIPASSKERVEEWARENNIVQQFIEDACNVNSGQTMSRVLYEAFKNWSEMNGYMRLSGSTFYGRLEKLDGLVKRVDGAVVDFNVELLPVNQWASNAKKMPVYKDPTQKTTPCDKDGNPIQRKLL